MPFIYANGSAKLSYHFKLSSDPEDMIVTIGVLASGPPITTELTAIYDAWADNFVPNMSDEYTFRGFEIVGKDSGGAEYAAELFSNQAGAVSSTFLPSNVALLIQKRTGIPGRANRGRMYVPGHLTAGQVAENGTIAATPLGDFQLAATEFLGDLTNSPVTGISAAAILHPAGTNTPISALVVDDVVATQRRRLR